MVRLLLCRVFREGLRLSSFLSQLHWQITWVIPSRGTGMTAKSRNLLDQVYVVKETPIVSGSNKTGKSRNLLDQVYVVKENPIISEEQLSTVLVSDANG